MAPGSMFIYWFFLFRVSEHSTNVKHIVTLFHYNLSLSLFTKYSTSIQDIDQHCCSKNTNIVDWFVQHFAHLRVLWFHDDVFSQLLLFLHEFVSLDAVFLTQTCWTAFLLLLIIPYLVHRRWLHYVDRDQAGGQSPIRLNFFCGDGGIKVEITLLWKFPELSGKLNQRDVVILIISIVIIVFNCFIRLIVVVVCRDPS